MSLAIVACLATTPLLGQGSPFTGSATVRLAAGSAQVVSGEPITLELEVDLTGMTGQGPSGSTPVVLGGYQIEVAFDAALVQFITASGGSAAGFGQEPTFTAPAQANAQGSVTLVASQTSSTAPTGNASVAVLTFVSVQPGAATFSAAPLSLSSAFQLPTFGPESIPGTGEELSITIEAPPSPPGPFVYISPADGASGVDAPVTLSWSDASGATTYEVQLSEQNPPGFAGVTNGTAFQVETQTGTSYYWRIVANGPGGSTAGTIWSFTTSGPTCPALTTPTASAPTGAPSGTDYALAWTIVPNASEYTVEESLTSSFSALVSTRTVVAPATTSTFRHAVTADTAYFYRVRANNTAGGCQTSSEWSRTVIVAVAKATTPPPPPEPDYSVLPVAGSLPGGFGSFFRTSLQLHNPTSGTIRGKLVFHAQGAGSGGGDPFLPYELGPRATLSFRDVIATMNLTGLGSLDIVPDAGMSSPVATARVFNDAGDAGTSGMAFDQVDPRTALSAGQAGIIVVPEDLASARFNLGVRSLELGVTMLVNVYDKTGLLARTLTKTVASDVLVQESSENFLGGAPAAGGVIEFRVQAGSAIVYGTHNDNKTNDPSYQAARRIQ